MYLDVIGLLPTPEQLQAFLNDAAPDKRARLIRQLLDDRRGYAEHWLTFWNDLLRNDYAGTGYIDGGRKQITGWLYPSLLDNKPYDRFVRELISPTPESEGFIKGIKWRGNVNASQVREIQFSQNVVAGVLRHQHEVRVVPRQLHRPLEARRRLRPGRGDRRAAAGDAPLRQADRPDRQGRSSSGRSWARSTRHCRSTSGSKRLAELGDAPGQRPASRGRSSTGSGSG